MESNESIKWEIIERADVVNRNNFWKAILLSILKPHLINRRLAGAEQICVFRSNTIDINSSGQLINKFVAYINSQTEAGIDVDFIRRAFCELNVQADFEHIDNKQLSTYDLNKDRQILIILNKLMSKNVSNYGCTYEINIIGNLKHTKYHLTSILKKFDQL